jgi:hypothetical protein
MQRLSVTKLSAMLSHKRAPASRPAISNSRAARGRERERQQGRVRAAAPTHVRDGAKEMSPNGEAETRDQDAAKRAQTADRQGETCGNSQSRWGRPKREAHDRVVCVLRCVHVLCPLYAECSVNELRERDRVVLSLRLLVKEELQAVRAALRALMPCAPVAAIFSGGSMCG